MTDFVKYHVPAVTIDGADIAAGELAVLRLYGHVKRAIDGVAAFIVEDWAGPTVTDWKRERPRPFFLGGDQLHANAMKAQAWDTLMAMWEDPANADDLNGGDVVELLGMLRGTLGYTETP